MKILYAVLICASLFVATVASGGSGDPIEPKDLKYKISLTLGSKGTIQFKQRGNELIEPALVKDPDWKQPGIGVEFRKEPKFLALALRNSLAKALRYRAAIRLKGQKDYTETSLIAPIRSGLISYEAWQDPIEELVLFDFALTDEKL
jgi:hypothetical protein